MKRDKRPRYSTVSIDAVKVPTPELGLDSESVRISAFRRGHKLNHRFIRPGIREAIQNGGAWEVNVDGLSGVLADGQSPAAHATSHQNGGVDEVSVAGLSGVLADPQTPITEDVQDITGLMATDSTSVELNYDDTAGTITPLRAALTGDVTAALNSNSTTIANDVVTNGKMADMAQSTIKGRAAGAGTGDPTDLTSAQATAILDLATTSVKGLAPVLSNVATEFLNGTGAYSTPTASTDLKWTATPGSHDLAVAGPVTIISTDVTGVAAGDQILVDGWFRILNDSTLGRVYTVDLNFDSVFACVATTGSMQASATAEHWFKFEGVLTVLASNSAEMMFSLDGRSIVGIAAATAETGTAAHLGHKVWDSNAGDLTGTVTVTLKVTSASASATQTLKLRSATIRKVTPT